jgi:hypothetical protein
MALTTSVSVGGIVYKTNFQECIDTLTSIANSVTFSPAYSPTYSALSKISATNLTELQTATNGFETRFSGNCNCLTNTNCNQTCQSTGYSQCTVAQCANQSYANQSSINCANQSTSQCTKSNQSCQSNQD